MSIGERGSFLLSSNWDDQHFQHPSGSAVSLPRNVLHHEQGTVPQSLSSSHPKAQQQNYLFIIVQAFHLSINCTIYC